MVEVVEEVEYEGLSANAGLGVRFCHFYCVLCFFGWVSSRADAARLGRLAWLQVLWYVLSA